MFDSVKDAVTTREVAESYGIPVNRAGMVCCIFHTDHTPSMKVDRRYHCFGCGADGDVIDFAARLFDLNVKEAAEKLAADFQISYDHQATAKPIHMISPTKEKRFLLARLKNYQNANYHGLVCYLRLLEGWQKQYAPKPEDEEWHPLFTESLRNIDRVNYLLDELQSCTVDEAKKVIACNKNEIAHYIDRVQEFRPRPKREAKELSH